MMITGKILPSYCVRRFIFTTCVNKKAKNYASREGKFMGKMIYGNTSKKVWHTGKVNLPHQPFTPTSAAKIVTPLVQRRLNVLNKIFMETITSIMATGELSSEIIGRSVEISRVQMSNDFNFVRVYWFSTENNINKQNETAKLLDKIANRLRHQVSQMRVVGVVPPILFVKDKKLDRSVIIDKLMLTADYGDDYAPAIKIISKPELTLYSKLPDDVRKKIIEIDRNKSLIDEEISSDGDEIDDDDDEIYKVNLPPMKHDVLGLNHWAIMSKIKQSLSKAKAAKNRPFNSQPIEQQRPFDPALIKPLRTEEEERAFSDFLLKRKMEEKNEERYALQNLNSRYDSETLEYNADDDDDYLIEEPDRDDFDDINPQELN